MADRTRGDGGVDDGQFFTLKCLNGSLVGNLHTCYFSSSAEVVRTIFVKQDFYSGVRSENHEDVSKQNSTIG